MKINYNPKLKPLARELRKNSTLAEVLLWEQLKARKLCGYQFSRQKPIDEYIVDFFSHELRLAIEIDESTHDDRLEKDRARQDFLESLGFKVIRFLDSDVKSNMQGVVSQLELVIDEIKETNKKN